MNSTQAIVTRNVHGKKLPDAKYAARLINSESRAETTSEERNALVLRNVKFLSTGHGSEYAYESGFGCGIVARGELVGQVENTELLHLQEINFNGLAFCTKNDQMVTSASLVVFTEHGIFAVL